MTRYIKPPFQMDRPLFCKTHQTAMGRTYEPGSLFDWKKLKIDPKVIQIMYVNDQFYHSDELEETLAPTVGDGLDELNIESLHKIVDRINTKVKSLDDDKIRPCKKSNIKVKQAALIRSWRLYHGEHE